MFRRALTVGPLPRWPESQGGLSEMTTSHRTSVSLAGLAAVLSLGGSRAEEGECIRAGDRSPAVEAMGMSQEPHTLILAQAAAARLPEDPARSVARLADALKRNPARRVPMEGNRLRLYLMDLVDGGTTLIADEPEPGFNWINTPKWSHDGTRIVFATWPLPGFEQCRIKAIELRDGRPESVDLGPGNSPTLSP